MDFLFYPILIYYDFFSRLLPFAEWVLGIGILLLLVTRKVYKDLKSKFLSMSFFIRIVLLIVVLLGLFGSMPTILLYGAIGGEIGGRIGEGIDTLFGFSWKFVNLVGSAIGAMMSVMAMLIWSVLIWSIVGGLLGYGFNSILKVMKKQR